jgi:transcriptional regulator with XRE-family HTH domain
VIQLKVDKVISERINKILIERNLTVNKLATLSCLTQSTVDSLVNGRSKNPKLLTIMKICDGLNMSLEEFFDDDVFINIDEN